MDFYNFYIGKEFQAYAFLGAHVWEKGGHLPREHLPRLPIV